eukprot:s4002_g1.t1
MKNVGERIPFIGPWVFFASNACGAALLAESFFEELLRHNLKCFFQSWRSYQLSSQRGDAPPYQRNMDCKDCPEWGGGRQFFNGGQLQWA